jgi:signal transduction histidine kinase
MTDAESSPIGLPNFRPIRADDPRLRTYDGFGLGLAVVKEFVSMLGGTVTAQSEGPGKGAAFTVWLPWIP